MFTYHYFWLNLNLGSQRKATCRPSPFMRRASVFPATSYHMALGSPQNLLAASPSTVSQTRVWFLCSQILSVSLGNITVYRNSLLGHSKDCQGSTFIFATKIKINNVFSFSAMKFKGCSSTKNGFMNTYIIDKYL